MLKQYLFWLKLATFFQLFTFLAHSSNFFVSPEPQNEAEKQLLELMKTYKPDMGAGFNPSTDDLFTSMSACFSLFCLFGGLINWYLIKKKLEVTILKGFITISLVIFGGCFAIMSVFTFLLPIICTGLIFLTLGLSLLTIPKQ